MSRSSDDHRDVGLRKRSVLVWVLPLAAGILTVSCTAALLTIAGILYFRAASQQPIVRIRVDYAGMPAEVVDEELAVRLARWCRESPHVQEVQSISSDGRADVYVTGTPGADAEALLQSINSQAAADMFYLPPGVSPPVVTLLSADEQIPDVTIQQVDTQDIVIDRERLAALGITAAELNAAIHNANESQGRINPDMPLTFGDHTIRLSDVTTISLAKRPSHVVRKHPMKN